MNEGMTSSVLMIVLMFALMYFLIIRPEKKRKQQAESMRNSLKKGDIITTIGGIMGKVVSVNDESFVIETSEDRVRMEFAKWALNTNATQEVSSVGKKGKKTPDESEKATEEVASAEIEEN